MPPLMLKTTNNPGGLLVSAFDQIRASVVADRSQFFQDLSIPFDGYNKPEAKISQGVRDSFWAQNAILHQGAAGLYQARQSSNRNPGTRPNSSLLCVTRIKLRALACPAISTS